jgi:tripartite-type tricarboxylate transporter receptor subunit TctC
VPVRIVNKPGGATIPGVDEVMKSAPDGYKVLWDTNSSSSIIGATTPDLPFNVMDRTFIAIVTESPVYIAVATDSRFKNLNEIVEFIKADPTAVTWTSLGGSSSPDVGYRRLFAAIGVDASKTRSVMSRGGAEAAVQTAGGHVMFGGATYSSYSSLLAAGKLRLIAGFAKRRSPILPNVPTTAELGYPTTESVVFNGFSGPPKMPKEGVDRYVSTIKEIVRDKEVLAEFAKLGLDLVDSDPEKMRQAISEELEVVKKLFGRPAK